MRVIIFVLALSILLLASALSADQAITMTRECSMIQNGMRDIRFVGDIGFCTYPGVLKAYDFTDPGNPILLSEFDFGDYGGGPVDFDIKNNYLYLPLSNRGILILDISNPAGITEVGFYPEELLLRQVLIHGNYLYQIQFPGDLIILDVTDPVNPVEANVLSNGTATFGKCIDISGNILALDNEWNGIYFYDISDPVNPVLTGTYDEYGNEYDVKVVGDRAYICGRGYGLVIVDISDPAHPAELGRYDPIDENELIEKVDVSGNCAYIKCTGIDAYDGYRIIDVSNPTAPTMLTAGALSEAIRDVYVKGDLLYTITNGRGLKLINIADPFAQYQVSEIPDPHEFRAIDVENDIAYIITGKGEPSGKADFLIFDVSDRSNPVLLAQYLDFQSGYGYDIDAIGTTVYISWGSKLQIVDAADPTSLITLYEDNPGASISEMEIRDNYMYCADMSTGLSILDISNPSSPQFVSTAPVENAKWDVEIEGDYAYLSEYHGVRSIDISDPNNPVEVGFFYYDNLDVRGMKSDGDLLYLVSQTAELMVLDISDPTTPTYMGQYGRYGDNSSLFAINDLVVVATSGGLKVYDLFTPSNPVYIGTPNGSNSDDVFVDDSYIYSVNRNYVTILSYDLASAVYGDCDQSGDINIGDVVYTLNFIFKDGQAPIPLRSGDANCDENVNIGDAIYLISYIFKGGDAPGCD